MAETQSEKKKAGLTRGKAALIGVLSVVLLAVLYIQFGPSGDDSSAETAALAPRRQPGAPAAATTSPAATDDATTPTENQIEVTTIIDPTKWKSPKIQSVIAHDPFALPVTFPQPAKVVIDPNMAESGDAGVADAAENAKKLAEAVEQRQRTLDELKQRGVQVIVRQRDQYAAMIGDRMVYVGDEIEGFVITEIRPDGVRVEGKVEQ